MKNSPISVDHHFYHEDNVNNGDHEQRQPSQKDGSKCFASWDPISHQNLKDAHEIFSLTGEAFSWKKHIFWSQICIFQTAAVNPYLAGMRREEY